MRLYYRYVYSVVGGRCVFLMATGMFSLQGEVSMTKSIYVGNLPYSATEDELRTAFSQHGNVHSVKLITDRETGKPRGFAFVEMDAQDADGAVEAMNGHQMGGRPLRVNLAQERAPRGGGGPGRPRR